jgi:hypothetical protein
VLRHVRAEVEELQVAHAELTPEHNEQVDPLRKEPEAQLRATLAEEQVTQSAATVAQLVQTLEPLR